MAKRTFVLLSGGLDSATCLATALEEYYHDNVTAVSVNYNQKHSRELDCASRISLHYEVPHYVINLSEIFKYSNNPLLSQSTENIPEGSYEFQQKNSDSGIVSTYIPFRNGLMVSAVASFAMSMYPNDTIEIWLGNHKDDAAGDAYPDCSKKFTSSMSEAIYTGTGNKVSLYSPFVNFTKADIVNLGLGLHVPYEYTTSCYNGKYTACGKCGTCIDRINAFKANNAIDPIEYEGEDPFKELR